MQPHTIKKKNVLTFTARQPPSKQLLNVFPESFPAVMPVCLPMPHCRVCDRVTFHSPSERPDADAVRQTGDGPAGRALDHAIHRTARSRSVDHTRLGGGIVCVKLKSVCSLFATVLGRHVRGSRKRIPGSDPKDLDPRSVRIIDPTLTVCRQIHWDHRSAFAISQEIHSDPRSKTPYCVGIHRDPISDKRNLRIFYGLF